MFLQKKTANAIRILSIDAIQKANSGHPGAPMGMADIADVLWRKFIKHNPKNPQWINRDRFILSNGHAAMLLYSILHLTGYNLSIQDIKQFRQLNSKTPGHPEYGITEGVETTTGPLGQGLANAIGMAISEKILSIQFNKTKYKIINHYTYVFVGDGCLMEGISHESCSLAGTMKLGKLIVFYDNNGISIDGEVNKWFTDNTKQRFMSYGWQVIDKVNGHNYNQINFAIKEATNNLNQPSLIICNTNIGWGAPNKYGSHEIHGSPLGTKEIKNTRKNLNWNEPPFTIPKEIYKKWNAVKKGEIKEKEWNKLFNEYKEQYPKLAKELIRRINKKLTTSWYENTQQEIKKIQIKQNLIKYGEEKISTRLSSLNTLEKIGEQLPELLGGSADLTPSNMTKWSKSSPIFENTNAGNYIHYGVREFGMTSIANGMSIYGGIIPYTATFLTFTEYNLNAIRMAALMNIHHIMIYTHDSIGVGEDGPTHQPIEQLSILRLIPNLNVWRPCDSVETFISWKYAIETYKGPTAIILSRQNITSQKRNIKNIKYIYMGGYILKDCKNNTPEIIIISTGSEIELAVKIYKKLKIKKINVRVVSLPSINTFEQQSKEYKEYVLPNNIKKRLVIEAGVSNLWYKYVGDQGDIIGINNFGKSAPAEKLFKEFGFSTKNILKKIEKILK